MKKPMTRTVKKRPQEVKDKISKGMKEYWDNVILLDEDGNLIKRKDRK